MVRRGPTDEFEPALKAFFVRRRDGRWPRGAEHGSSLGDVGKPSLAAVPSGEASFLGGCTASSASSLRVLCWNQLGPSKVYRSQPENI
jgi:hypothetical protein